jgi:UDP-N-acetylglucosamine transferase subunit ALG13
VKIFVTVGTQLPFDRLIAAVDSWAAEHDAEVFAQTGGTSFRPQNIAWKDFIDSGEAGERIRTADLVVAHAGMGTILTRCETGLPMIVMPRRAELGEHRNNHQIATASRLSHLPGLWVVGNEDELHDRLTAFRPQASAGGLEAVASPALISAVRDFVLQ